VTRVALEIPKVGLVMESVRLVRWLKNVGDSVAQGEPLVELETEKSVVEIECTESGRLADILVQPDQEARVGDRIAWIETDIAAATPTNTGRVVSSPAARRLAAVEGVDLRQIRGTGPRGRVRMLDVRRSVDSRVERAASAIALPRLSSMRRALARSMTLSNATVPQFTVERAVDWTAVNKLREAATEDPQAPSITDFVLQAMAAALLACPALNATFVGDPESADADIAPASGAHIGLVVAVEDGLLVPVMHGVEKLGLAELTRQRRAIGQRALTRTLKADELEGATISLSNLGARGPDRFNALINPPQSAILAVGRQADRVVALNGGIHVRAVSQLALTVDHRVADGRLAADFLAFLVDRLEGAHV
jgi:pyruvate dehydrogenase E2 component (dihydrolipoamide acetyltransferase)